LKTARLLRAQEKALIPELPGNGRSPQPAGEVSKHLFTIAAGEIVKLTRMHH
jgi:hypothetical protein